MDASFGHIAAQGTELNCRTKAFPGLHVGPGPVGVVPSLGDLFKRSLPVFTQVSEETTEKHRTARSTRMTGD